MIEKMNIPFSPPDISNKEVALVKEALLSGWITTGPKTKEFERQIANYVGTPKAVCLNSATACLELCLRLLGIKKGDEVITSAYTYTASASVIDHVGAKIVMVDIANNGIEMDYAKLEKAITEKTKAIIPVDIAGIPCDYKKIYSIVNSKKSLFKANNDIQKALGRIAVIADSAHSFGAYILDKNGNKTMDGNIADFTSFSFHAVKNFTTGEGGALSWKHIKGIDDEEIYKTLQLYSLHGQNKDALSKTKLGCWEYDIVGTWYKCNMTDIMAGIGLAQLERYPDMLKKRKAIIEKYDKALKPLGIETLNHYTDKTFSSGHLYITRIPNITMFQRNEIINKMAEEGVATNVHYKPLPMMTAYKNLGFNIKNYPNAEKYFINEITLPLYTKLTNMQVDYIIEKYIKIVKEYL